MRAPRSILLSTILLLAGMAPAGPGQLHVTDFGRRILVRTDQIVEAKVLSVQPAFRGITTARLSVLEKLWGFDRERIIVLLYVDDLTAPDAFGSTLERATVSYEKRRRAGLKKAVEDLAKGKPPKAETTPTTGVKEVKKSTEKGATIKRGKAGVRLAAGEQGLFFLRRKGASYALLNMLTTADPLYKSKLARLKEILRLEAILALDLRATQAKRFFLAGLSSPQEWERGNSAREVLSLATRFPEIFTKEETKRLTQALLAEKEVPIQAALERAVRCIDPEAALAFAEGAEERERIRFEKQLAEERVRIDKITLPQLRAADVYRAGRTYGRAATGLLALYLSDGEAIVRERAAEALGQFGGPSCRPALREALADERDGAAAGALIHACGVKSDPDAVDLIAARLSDGELEHVAIQALARIGTPKARAALKRHRASAGAETANLIDALLHEEFEGSK